MMYTETTTWNDKPETKLGNYGENLIKKELENRGFSVYSPEFTDTTAHPIDGIAFGTDYSCLYFECKTKEKLTIYNCTGINTKNLDTYIELSKKHDMKLYVFFIDSSIGKILYGEINDLMVEYESDLSYPCTTLAHGITMLPIDLMETYRDLTVEEIYDLKRLKCS